MGLEAKSLTGPRWEKEYYPGKWEQRGKHQFSIMQFDNIKSKNGYFERIIIGIEFGI
jgi:hypothetical protein